MLKDKETYSKIILYSLPLTVVATTAYTSLLICVISLLAVVVSTLFICMLKTFLTEKTVLFAKVIISLGVVGALTMTATVFFKEITDSVSLYLPLISLTTVLLLSGQETIEATTVNALKISGVEGGISSGFLFAVGILREFLGFGSLFGIDIYTKVFSPMELFKNPAGALFIAAMLALVYNILVSRIGKRGAK